MTMYVSFHLRPWINKYSYRAWHQGIMKPFPYGFLVGQRPSEKTLPTGWEIKLHIYKILLSSLKWKSRVYFSYYCYHYHLSLNQYNLTHCIPFRPKEFLFWMLVHKIFTYSKKFFMPGNSVNPINYGKTVPSDNQKNKKKKKKHSIFLDVCLSISRMFFQKQSKTWKQQKKRLVEQKQYHTTQSVSIYQSGISRHFQRHYFLHILFTELKLIFFFFLRYWSFQGVLFNAENVKLKHEEFLQGLHDVSVSIHHKD